jgi:hypothetical protein
MVGVWLSARLTVDGAESRRSEAGLSSTQLAESLPKRCFLGGDKSNNTTRKVTAHLTGRLEVKVSHGEGRRSGTCGARRQDPRLLEERLAYSHVQYAEAVLWKHGDNLGAQRA